jgi:hypothetical protein
MSAWLTALGRPTWRSTLALLSIVVAYALLVQGRGANQNASYALVKALASGTATVDKTRYQVGDVGTPDVAWFNGHYYAAKAPGLALLTLPEYLLLRSVGMRTTGDPTNMLWALGLLGVVLPIAITLFLVRHVTEGIEPGYGTITAATLGLGTLLFPFGTMFFVHSLSAMLGFAAFVLLWSEQPTGRLSVVAAAGVVAGLAITSEYPLGLVALALAAYTIRRTPRLKRLAAFTGGVIVGVFPLMVFNLAAFGSLTHLSYQGTVQIPGVSGHDVLFDYEGLFGVAAPSLHAARVVLFSNWGFVTTAPVLVAAIAGLPMLFRRGYRSEALLAGAIAFAFVVYDSGFLRPWGDVAPGARYLIPMLPFLALPLCVAFRAFPYITLGLASVSAAIMVSVTITRPMAAWDGHVLERLRSSQLAGYSPTAPDVFGITGWYDVLPLFAALALAVFLTISATPLPPVSLHRLIAAGIASILAVTLLRAAPDRWSFSVAPRTPADTHAQAQWSFRSGTHARAGNPNGDPSNGP